MQETENAVLEFDTAECVPPDDNRPAERPGIKGLIEGMRTHNQLVPGLVCPHPELAGKYLILDGVGRWHACGKLGIPFRAIPLPAVVPEAERIKLRFQHNVIRRNLTQDEIADDAKRYMSLMGCTQEQAAQELSLSTATVSRALAVKQRIPSELRPMAEAVRPSIASMIATLEDADAMRQVFEYATTAGKNGKQPTRDQVANFLEPLRKKKPRGARGKTLKGTVDGRKVEFSLVAGESTDSVIEFLRSLAAKLGKYRDLPPESLSSLLNG